MPPFKYLLAAASIAALCTPALAQTPPAQGPDQQHHGWHMPSAEQMTAWHAQMCKDRYAHEAGKLAYLQASLGITEAQRGAFDRWRDEKLAAAKSHSEECAAHIPMEGRMDGKMEGHEHNALERNARMEKHLEAKLAEMRSERPALEAFYNSLSPEQKKLFDREAGHRHHGHHMMMDGMRHGMHPGMDHDGQGEAGPG